MLIPKLRTIKAIQSHREKGSQRYLRPILQKYLSNETEEKLQNTLSHDARAVDEEIGNGEDNNEKILVVTDAEIQAAITNLKKGKASDNNGIRAEDIKNCGVVTKGTIKHIFNEV